MSGEKKNNILGFSQIVYPLRLTPGEEVTSRLQQFISDANLKAGYIITCVGSVTNVKLRMAEAKDVCTVVFLIFWACFLIEMPRHARIQSGGQGPPLKISKI